MIQAIACDIADIVYSTGYVNTHFEYCELVRKGDLVYPAQYIGGGRQEQVHNHDVNGNSYLRSNGAVLFSSPQGASNKRTKACGGVPFVEMTFPLRLVMVVPKSKLQDDAFSDHRLSQDMIAFLQGPSTVTYTGIIKLYYKITSYQIDALAIWRQEIQGMDYQMNFDYAYVAINFNAVVTANPNCLLTSCY